MFFINQIHYDGQTAKTDGSTNKQTEGETIVTFITNNRTFQGFKAQVVEVQKWTLLDIYVSILILECG